MKPNKTYKDEQGHEFFMCPFPQFFITQGEEVGTHIGTYAVDVNHYNGNWSRVPYYAPATVKCIKVIPSYGEATWQTVNKVHCPNGYFGIVTFETVHDESFDAYPGLIVKQGQQLGNMGMKPTNICSGVHCHFEGCQSTNTHMDWYNGVYTYDALECKIQDLCFMDDTNCLTSRKWKYTKDAKPHEDVKPSTVKWVDGVIKVGDTVKSISCETSGTNKTCVNVPSLGGFVPFTDVKESADTRDGKVDGLLKKGAKVYLTPCTVQAVDGVNNLVKVHGYWVNPKPLLIKKG